MNLRRVSVVFFLVCFVVALPLLAQQKSGLDAIAGMWTGDWGPNANDRNQVTVDLKFDGKALTGNVNPPGQTPIPIQKGTFDPKTGVVHMEADAKGRGGATVHYIIDGKVEKNIMTGTWNHDNRKGDFKITKK